MVTSKSMAGWARWRSPISDLLLAGLLLGPLAAPFLYDWGAFGPRTVASIIYTMGTFVCPQPTYGLALPDGHLMAVCMRCYGTVLGFLATRVGYALDRGANPVWLPRYGLRGLAIFGLLIFAYAAELAGQVAGWWQFDDVAVTIAGLATGIGLGLMFHPLLHAGVQPSIAERQVAAP